MLKLDKERQHLKEEVVDTDGVCGTWIGGDPCKGEEIQPDFHKRG